MKLAILHQSQPAPPFKGAFKPMKDGGYSDSGADIAYALKMSGLEVVTAVKMPDAAIARDWVFGDTKSEIKNALKRGADCLWLNTQLHEEHPILDFQSTDIYIVGQDPPTVQRYDDKYVTNKYLRSLGYPTVDCNLIDMEEGLSEGYDARYPSVIKPVRGRGSQGVELIENEIQLRSRINNIEQNTFGRYFMIEPFLPGKELTITVLPAGRYHIDDKIKAFSTPWCLPPVVRKGSGMGIAPYSGRVPVSSNSSALNTKSLSEGEWVPLLDQCSKVGALLGIRAPIRIDCRQDNLGRYLMFDINLKPNLTGTGRPGRDLENGLTTLAARSFGWSYRELLINMLHQKWQLKDLL